MNCAVKDSYLNNIFWKNPENINTEYVHKAKVNKTPVYIDPLFSENEELRDFLETNLVTIITPDSIEAVQSKVKKDNIRILQSPYENWRVLESDKKIIIDWVEYTVVIKWVWTTGYYRETGAIDPWMSFSGYSMREDEKESLKSFPFYEEAGIYDMDKALLELERSKALQEIWVDTERVLWIYELEEVLWEDWKYISIEELETNEIISKWLKPVILIRAHKTNLRLLDYIMLDKYDRKESITPLVDYVLEESEKYWWTENISQYLEKLIETILVNRLNLISKYSTLNWEFWKDVFRNFSAFWEELDLWTMIPMNNDSCFTNPNYFKDHYKREILTVFTGFNQIIKVIEKNTNHKIDHKQLADKVFNVIVTWIKTNKDELENYYRDNNWNKWESNEKYNFNNFLYWFFKSCFSIVLDYMNSHEYTNILEKKVKWILGD